MPRLCPGLRSRLCVALPWLVVAAALAAVLVAAALIDPA